MKPSHKDCPGQLLLIQSDPNVYVRCRVCQRILRRPASVAKGVGPTCERMEKNPITDGEQVPGSDTFHRTKSA